MALVAFQVVPVAIAFFGAAVLLLLVRALSLREAYDVDRMADPRHARRADPGQRSLAHDRRHRSHRRMAVRRPRRICPPPARSR